MRVGKHSGERLLDAGLPYPLRSKECPRTSQSDKDKRDSDPDNRDGLDPIEFYSPTQFAPSNHWTGGY
jgi:hypothetical protein